MKVPQILRLIGMHVTFYQRRNGWHKRVEFNYTNLFYIVSIVTKHITQEYCMRTALK